MQGSGACKASASAVAGVVRHSVGYAAGLGKAVGAYWRGSSAQRLLERDAKYPLEEQRSGVGEMVAVQKDRHAVPPTATEPWSAKLFRDWQHRYVRAPCKLREDGAIAVSLLLVFGPVDAVASRNAVAAIEMDQTGGCGRVEPMTGRHSLDENESSVTSLVNPRCRLTLLYAVPEPS